MGGLEEEEREKKVYDVAKRYFETISRTIRELNPFHLVLGIGTMEIDLFLEAAEGDKRAHRCVEHAVLLRAERVEAARGNRL